MLRELGCQLPIELWHLGNDEIPPSARRGLVGLAVRCVDAREVQRQHGARILNGWEVKAFALLHNSFEQVLLLDADNVPVRDPTYLFDDPQFLAQGALFWPDRGTLPSDKPIWALCGVAGRSEPEFESGQILVDKRRAWRALGLAMWMNEHSDFFYRHVHGDKETFHLAFARLKQPYYMCPKRQPFDPHGTFMQVDPDGEVVFQHRSGAKWHLFGDNVRQAPAFQLEDDCLRYLGEFRERLTSSADEVDAQFVLACRVGGMRCEPMGKALAVLNAVPRPVIVEIGSIRSSEQRFREGDGWSTLAFAYFTEQYGGEFHSVDVSSDSVEVARRLTGARRGTQFHICDGVKFLRDFGGPIDLLYLDAWDPSLECSDATCEQKALECAQVLRYPPRFVLVDDVPVAGDFGEKGRLVVPWLIINGYRILFRGGNQALLARVASDAPAAPNQLLPSLVSTPVC